MINQRGLFIVALATLALVGLGLRFGSIPETHIATLEVK